jgi:tRNA modification GTPase
LTEPDTICAVATPPGEGSVGIVRVSGPDAGAHCQAVAGVLPPPRQAVLRRFRDADGEILDHGLVLFFPAPNSFTGEDVVEFQGHGGPVVLDRMLRRLTGLGARLARPGEFSERAFLNGRIDLTQAEAIADLIAARSEQGARAALRSLSGAFSETVHELVHDLTGLRVQIEAAIDFPDDELELLGNAGLPQAFDAFSGRLAATRRSASEGRLLAEGLTVVLAGRPNAGKSSLLNRLAGADAAIVTDVPGTTRDLLRERLHLDGLPLHVIDTAGLRESVDVVEQAGIQRARTAMAEADRILLVLDDRDADAAAPAELPAGVPVTRIRNKIDLSGREPGPVAGAADTLAVSALTGAGMEALRGHLKRAAGYSEAAARFSARRRHLVALDRAAEHLRAAREALTAGLGAELIAEDLRLAQNALGEITGAVTADDLLGEIFSSFCLGK